MFFFLLQYNHVTLHTLIDNGMSIMNKLVGRERECQELKRVMESDRSEFVIQTACIIVWCTAKSQ